MESDTSWQATGLCEGEILAGKYRVESILGAGAMGFIVGARHLLLEGQVAIKFLLPAVLTNDGAVARFVQEARAASQLRSEHTVRVTDVAFLENGSPFIVMEYLEGMDLAAWLKTRGRLPAPQAVEFVLQACEALAEAHANGIVHRDLKPANLFVVTRADGTQCLKVLDFGISKVRQSEGLQMTHRTTMLGSPRYMSPEQMESASSVDARTDIWALGVVLFELLTGQQPYAGESLPALYAKILSSEPVAPSTLVAGLPPQIDTAVLTCLERDRAARYASIDALAAALLPFAVARPAPTPRASWAPPASERAAWPAVHALAQPLSPGDRLTPAEPLSTFASTPLPSPRVALAGPLMTLASEGAEPPAEFLVRRGRGKVSTFALGVLGGSALVALTLGPRLFAEPRRMPTGSDSKVAPATATAPVTDSAFDRPPSVEGAPSAAPATERALLEATGLAAGTRALRPRAATHHRPGPFSAATMSASSAPSLANAPREAAIEALPPAPRHDDLPGPLSGRE